MAAQEENPKMTPEMMRNNQELAAQAALRAQQIMFRKSIGASESLTNSPIPTKKTPPEVPARGDSHLSKHPPEIPPKRHSLKSGLNNDDNSTPLRQPPPLPQKPSSAQNSPMMAQKLRDKPKPPPPPPIASQMQNKFDQSTSSKPVTPISNIGPVLSQNPFLARNSPQLNQRPKPLSANVSPQLPNSQRTIIPVAPLPKATIATPAKKPISPIEDSSSEDALRGIESGLRNMERAMQEQMSRSAAATAVAVAQQPKSDKTNFNVMEFKRSVGGSVSSLDGTTQNVSIIEAMRMTLNKQQNIRSMERGFSMDQMRLDSINLSNMRSTLEEMKNGSTRPIDNHMKSLDRNLPLELQYSRHHHRSQSQQEMVEQMRQNLMNPNANGAATTVAATSTTAATGPRHGTGSFSRDDVRLRRRSSHDENQSQPNAPGNERNQNDQIDDKHEKKIELKI